MYWAEVTKIKGTRKYRLYALIDTTEKTKPVPRNGGQDCLKITQELYDILRATRCDVKRAQSIAQHAYQTFVSPTESLKPMSHRNEPISKKSRISLVIGDSK